MRWINVKISINFLGKLNFIINDNSSIIEGLEYLNKQKINTLIVVSEEKKVIGTVTDGDIRRFLLQGGDIKRSIKEVCNKSYAFAKSHDDALKILVDLKENNILSIPIVDDNFKLIDVVDDKKDKVDINFSALIMAGGLGTRLRPLTENKPKPLLEINGEPIISRIIQNLSKAGIKEIFISIRYLSYQIKDYLKEGQEFNVNIKYIEEDKPLGTAGCLWFLPRNIKNLIIINGDIRTELNLSSLMDFHINRNSIATVAVRNYVYKIPYGVIDILHENIKEINEKPTKSYPVAAGIYALDMEKIRKLKVLPITRSFIDMPDLIKDLIKKDKKVKAFLVHEQWYDIGDLDTFNQLNQNQ